jgi:hypothetical protein
MQRGPTHSLEKLEFPVHRISDIALEKKLKRQSVRVQNVQDRFEKVNEVKNLTPMSRCNVETLWKMNPNPGVGIILVRYCIDSKFCGKFASSPSDRDFLIFSNARARTLAPPHKSTHICPPSWIASVAWISGSVPSHKGPSADFKPYPPRPERDTALNESADGYF